MNVNKYSEALGKPFDAKDVSWRLQYVDKEKLQGFAVPYLDARAISERLDSVVGQLRWKDSYTPWHIVDKKSSQICTIFIYDDELKEWIGKTDGAENSDVEPVKGGLSDAFKRAAVKWNIGRYMYSFEAVWVKAQKKGGGYIVDPSEKARLEEIYTRTVAEIFGGKPTQRGRKAAEAAEEPKQAPAKPEPPVQPVYEVKNVTVQNGQSGKNSVLTLSHDGKDYRAYLRGVDNRLQSGAKLKNLRVNQFENSFGKFNMLDGYEIAA